LQKPTPLFQFSAQCGNAKVFQDGLQTNERICQGIQGTKCNQSWGITWEGCAANDLDMSTAAAFGA
ncbi:hypothetical protein BAE44_0015607, partial [Dichanthelium oligosanthes]